MINENTKYIEDELMHFFRGKEINPMEALGYTANFLIRVLDHIESTQEQTETFLEDLKKIYKERNKEDDEA